MISPEQVDEILTDAVKDLCDGKVDDAIAEALIAIGAILRVAYQYSWDAS